MKTSKNCKRATLFLAAVLLLTSVFAVFPAFAATDATEIAVTDGIATNVVWNYGYVGSSVNPYGNANKISDNSNGSTGPYRYSDILTIPHAGTSISFSDPAGKSMSVNAYIISSWKQVNGAWVLDTDGTNIAGVGAKTNSIAVYNSTTKIVTYTYTTQKDNEHIRLGCYGTPGSAVCPTVYVGNSETNADGVLENIVWFPGYIASSSHGTVNIRDTIAVGGSGYTYSAPILLKKAGTKISFKVTKGGAITKFASLNAYVFSVWERNHDNSFLFGYGCPGNDQGKNTAWQTVDGDTYEYFYTSSYDNEYVRISYFSGAASNALPSTFPTVTLTENGGGDATLARAYYDPALVLSARTVTWNAGYVGSSANAGSTNKLNKGAGGYKYTDIIPVWGKGSLLMFTDIGGTGNEFASGSAYVFSSFASEDNSLINVDTTGTNLAGNNTSCYVVNPDGSRTYYYYTTKDVEYIRISMRSDSANYGTINKVSTSFIAPAVYVISSANLVKWNAGSYIMGNPNATWGNGLYSTNTHADYTYTDYFTVPKAGTTISIPAKSNVSANIAVFSTYDKNGDTYTGVSALMPAKASYTTNGSTRRYTYTTTRDNEILRLCTNSKYTGTAGNYFLPVLTSTIGTYSSLFAGKEMTIIGDSYFAGNGIDKNFVWPKLFADLYGMTFYNQGINGSAISDSSGDNKYNPMVNRWNKMQGSENTALVLFEGGRNDYNQKTPIGELGDTTTKTFYGAIDTVMKGLLQKFPNALIVCLNPWQLERYPSYNNANSAGHTSNDYAAAFRNYVASLGNDRVVMLDTNNTGTVPVFIQDASFRRAYAQTPADGSHMNIKGMNFILPFFEQRLAEFMTGYTAMQNAGGGIVFSENGKPVQVKSTAEAGEITIPAPYIETTDALIGWSGTVGGKEVLLPVGGKLTAAAGESGTLTPKYLHMSSAGNTIRLITNSNGIRFLTEVNLAEYEALANIPGVTLSRGTLIVPEFYLSSLGNELTFDSLTANAKKHLHIKAGAWYQQNANSALFAGSIANIYEDHYTLAYVGTGYITVTFTDGSEITFYAAKTPATSVTVNALAETAYRDRNEARTEVYQYETEDGNYSPYTAKQREVLAGYLTSKVLTITGDATNGFAASAKSGVQFTVTVETDKDLLFVRRTDGIAITEGDFDGVYFRGTSVQFTVADGAIRIHYTEYTERY